MNVIQTSCLYSRKNLMQLQRALHQRTTRICLYLSLAGLAMLVFGIWRATAPMIFFGIFWLAFFLIFAEHPARKSVNQTLKLNNKLYGCEVEVQAKFYTTLLTAENMQSGKKMQSRYDEVEQVTVTKDLIVLRLPDNIAVMVDASILDEETREKLIDILTENCSFARFYGKPRK